MRSSVKTLVCLGLASVVSAVASQQAESGSHLQKRGFFKVERQENPNYSGPDGPRSLLKVLRKYSLPVSPELLGAVERSKATTLRRRRMEKRAGNGNGQSQRPDARPQGPTAPASATAAPTVAPAAAAVPAASAGTTNRAGESVGKVSAVPEENDSEYLSPIDIGGQMITVDFDTGSADLWVFSSALPAAQLRGHNFFDANKSRTFKTMPGAKFTISYGDGSGAMGSVGTDIVNVGGAVVERQAVELASQVSKSFVEDAKNSGLLGLSFSKVNSVMPQQQKTFFDNVMPSLAEPLFTADLRKEAPGSYEFGRIDTSKFTGPLNWVPVNPVKGFWQFTSDKFAIGGGPVQPSTPKNQAIADTGTTLILADPKIVTAYYSKIRGAQNNRNAGGITFPCDSQMPDLSLDIGGVMATVNGSLLNYAKVNAQTCFGGLQPSPEPNLQIYGDIFFKSNFVVFNGGNTSLGFAPATGA